MNIDSSTINTLPEWKVRKPWEMIEMPPRSELYSLPPLEVETVEVESLTSSICIAGARQGAPQATQIADRFHLYKNLLEAVELTLAYCRAEIRKNAILALQQEEIAPPLVENYESVLYDHRALCKLNLHQICVRSLLCEKCQQRRREDVEKRNQPS